MSDTEEAMKDIFNECQKGLHSHGQLIKRLQKIQAKVESNDFISTFINLMKHSMIIYKREPAVERTIDFIAKFTVSTPAIDQKVSDSNKDDEMDGSVDSEESETENEFLNKIIDFLLKSHQASHHAVRFRSCQLINKLLRNMGEDAQIDDNLYDSIYQAMLERMRDKFPLVRVQAVLSLTRLQDPTDKDCPIINAYLFMLSCDPNQDVRKAVLQSIATSTQTLPQILERTRDVKDVVRKASFIVIAEKIHIKALTIAQRIKLLKDGLGDRSDVVKEACASQLLQAWLRLYGGNILELLNCLDVEDAESMKTTELALQTMFKKSQSAQLVDDFDLLDEKLVIPVDNLTCESVFYWRCLSEYIRSGEQADDLIDRLVPTVSEFCQYVASYAAVYERETDLDIRLEQEYILQQLLFLAGVLDLSDEVGRKSLEKLIHDLLVSDKVSYTTVKPILMLLVKLKKDDKLRIQYLVEVIADIREPITTVETSISADEQRRLDIRIAAIRVKLNELREELEISINEQDFGKASELKNEINKLDEEKENLLNDAKPQSQEIRTEKNDAQTMLKCLTITAEMLLEVTLPNLTPALQTLTEVLIIPGIQNADPAVRNVAVKSLGLCCQMSKTAARAHFLLFIQIATVDTVTVQVSALVSIIDMLLTFGLDAFKIGEENDENEKENEADPDDRNDDEDTDDFFESDEKKTSNKSNQSVNSLVTILTALLDSEISEMRTVAAEGLAKLLISGRMVSSKLLSRLILLWYNPTTEDDIHLRHCLGTFFPEFAFTRRANQELIEEAFMPTLKTLFNAPVFSPLSTINAGNVADLMVQLTSTWHLTDKNKTNIDPQDCSLHSSLAIKLCNEILNDPSSFNVRTLAKILTNLTLNETNETDNRDIHAMMEQVIVAVKDKVSLKICERFLKTVADLLQNLHPEEGETAMDTTRLAPTETTLVETTNITEKDASIVNGDGKKKRGKKVLRSLAEQSMDFSAMEMSQLEDTVFGSPDVRQSNRSRRSKRTLSSDPTKLNLEKTLLEDEEMEISEPQTALKEKN
ncbi:condensin complex subunit 3-like [Tubulanus polymorphus]|uniref:condensin complex subunit 3-like n=1 Tax=Tubulanus polymorphus TaxID=672921 RepID=UPI003DA21570